MWMFRPKFCTHSFWRTSCYTIYINKLPKSLGTVASHGPCCTYQSSMTDDDGMTTGRKHRSALRQTYHSTTLSSTNPTWTTTTSVDLSPYGYSRHLVWTSSHCTWSEFVTHFLNSAHQYQHGSCENVRGGSKNIDIGKCANFVKGILFERRKGNMAPATLWPHEFCGGHIFLLRFGRITNKVGMLNFV